ncbi:MAG: hypothetical protein WAX89_06060 [Alphaproteobacteria bacterium]
MHVEKAPALQAAEEGEKTTTARQITAIEVEKELLLQLSRQPKACVFAKLCATAPTDGDFRKSVRWSSFHTMLAARGWQVEKFPYITHGMLCMTVRRRPPQANNKPKSTPTGKR